MDRFGHGTAGRLTRVAFQVLLALSIASAASAQTRLEAVLRPGRTVWITDSSGREARARIVGVSGGVVTATVSGGTRQFQAADIVRARVRRSDSLWNGALIGAGASVASGLLLCRAMEPWENCRDDVGPLIRIGALGAGIGIGADALIRGRRTIYEAPPRSVQLSVLPIVARRAGGVQVRLGF